MKAEKKEIKSGKITIGEAFNEWYNVPSYQRHYVWEKDNIIDLLDDIIDAQKNAPNDEYFLGSYVVQTTPEGKDLLDGQQRLTTLFILFAVLRDLESSSPDLKDECMKMVYQEENRYRNTPARVRILYQIRDKASNFINDYLIEKDSINSHMKKIEDCAENKTSASPTVKHICNAIIIIKEYFEKDHFDIDKDRLLQFIINNVVMIYVSADSLHDAFRFFSILNDRGLKLSNSDIIKSENLQKCKKEDVERYAKAWENMQETMDDDFDRFLSYVRTILVKEKAKSNLLDEFEKYVFDSGKIKQGIDFFKYIESAYKAYSELFGDDAPADIFTNCQLRNLIKVMQYSMKSTDWMAVLMSYYMKFGSENIFTFFKKLTCKAIADWVCGESPTRRIESMNKIIKEIDLCQDCIKLPQSETFKFNETIFLQELEADIYGRDCTKAILLILDYSYYDNNNLWPEMTQMSIEHILPQNPDDKSQWYKDYSEEDMITWTHKIGNLCLIGRRKNISLGRLDYVEKKNKYFKDTIANFANTLHIYHTYTTWKISDLKNNQNSSLKQIKTFFEMKN